MHCLKNLKSVIKLDKKIHLLFYYFHILAVLYKVINTGWTESSLSAHRFRNFADFSDSSLGLVSKQEICILEEGESCKGKNSYFPNRYFLSRTLHT